MNILKRAMALGAAVVLSVGARAQSGYTSVTANLASACYNNGSVQAAWQNGNPSSPTLPTLNGSPFNQYVPTGIDSTGRFQINLADTAIVQPNSPSLSSWNITACAKGGSQPACYTALNVPVTGANMDVTSYFTAATSACTSTVIEVNGVPLIKANPVNFQDTSAVHVTNPSLGNVQMTSTGVTTINNTPCTLNGSNCTISATAGSPGNVAGTNCNNATSGSITTATVVLSCPGFVAGNTVVLTVYSDQSLNAFFGVTFNVTDTQGNTYNLIGNDLGFQFGLSGAQYYAKLTQSGTDTITITQTTSNGASIISLLYGNADQFSNVGTITPVVQQSQYKTGSGAGGSPFNSPAAMTPTQSGDLLYLSNLQQGNTTIAYTATGYTSASTHCPVVGGAHGCIGTLYTVSSSATPSLWNPTVNWTPNQSASGMGFAVELTGGGNPNPVLSQYPGAGIPVATGNPSAPWTTSLTPRGSDTGSPTAGALSGAAGTLVCKDSNGGIDTTGCPSVSGPTRTCNANGCYVQLSDGTKHEWGTVLIPFSGATLGSTTVTYPLAFTTTTNLSVITNANQKPNGTADAFATYTDSGGTTSTTVYGRCASNVGGSGCNNFTGTVLTSWTADGN